MEAWIPASAGMTLLTFWVICQPACLANHKKESLNLGHNKINQLGTVFNIAFLEDIVEVAFDGS